MLSLHFWTFMAIVHSHSHNLKLIHTFPIYDLLYYSSSSPTLCYLLIGSFELISWIFHFKIFKSGANVNSFCPFQFSRFNGYKISLEFVLICVMFIENRIQFSVWAINEVSITYLFYIPWHFVMNSKHNSSNTR